MSIKLEMPCEENGFNQYYIALLCACLKKYQRYITTPQMSPQQAAKFIWTAPFVVISHSADENPFFVYANQRALELFEMTWNQMVHSHSNQSVEPAGRHQREVLLKEAHNKGIIDHYSGVRISTRGKRFYISNAIIWNLTSACGEYIGQAATFKDWHFID